MEDADGEDLVEEGVQQRSGQLSAVVGAERSSAHGEGLPVDPVHHQHAAPGQQGHAGWHGHHLVPPHRLGQVGQVAGLGLEVQLFEDAAGEAVYGGHQALVGAPTGVPFEPPGQPSQDVEVAVDPAGHLGALELNRDGPTVGQDRPMDLRHRGRGHGMVVEVLEHLVGHELLRLGTRT